MKEIDFSLMNYIDYISIGVVLISIIFGGYRGFIASVVSLLGWVLSIVLTYQFYPLVEEYLSESIKSKVLIIVIGSGSLLIFLLIIFGLINSLFYKLVGDLKKSFMDRSIGLLFGLARGILIISFLFLCFSISLKLLSGKKAQLTEKDYPAVVTNAVTFKLMEKGAFALESVLPESLNERFSELYDNISDKDLDERFIQNSIDKLTTFTSDDEIRKINLMRQDLSISKSQEAIEIKTLEYLLKNYKEKLKEGKINKKAFTQEEMERLDAIVNKLRVSKN